MGSLLSSMAVFVPCDMRSCLFAFFLSVFNSYLTFTFVFDYEFRAIQYILSKVFTVNVVFFVERMSGSRSDHPDELSD